MKVGFVKISSQNLQTLPWLSKEHVIEELSECQAFNCNESFEL